MAELTRPLLTLHVFGSEGCGKTTLKKQWFDSSHCKVLSEIADVHIRIQVCAVSRCNAIIGYLVAAAAHDCTLSMLYPLMHVHSVSVLL